MSAGGDRDCLMVGTRARILMALLVAVLLVPALDSSAVALTAAEKYARSAFRATNVDRVEHEIDKVDRRECLRRLAVAQARKMANREEIFHQDSRPGADRVRDASRRRDACPGFKERQGDRPTRAG